MTEEERRPPRIQAILTPLVRHGVDFVVVGGMAGTLQGSSIPSFDVDVAYLREHANHQRLADALSEIGVRLRGAPPDVPFVVDARTIGNGSNFTFITPFGDFDILGHVPGIKDYGGLRERALLTEAYGLTFRVASVDDLIAMKRAANRPKDQQMLEELLVIADEQLRREAE